MRVEAKPRLLRPFPWFSHLSWTMSLLTNEEKERIKGLRCHAEVTKKVKEGKRPVSSSRASLMKNFLTVTRFSLLLYQIPFISEKEATRRQSDQVFSLSISEDWRGQKNGGEIKKGQSIVYSSILMTRSFSLSWRTGKQRNQCYLTDANRQKETIVRALSSKR